MSTSSASLKKKGGPKRRTKRGDLGAVPTTPENAANSINSHGTHTETAPPPENPQLVPEKRWSCPPSNSENATFCKCLQFDCPYQCPIAGDILSRTCTNYSWPRPDVMGYNSLSLSAEPHTNHDPGVEARCQGDLIEDLGACKCVLLPTRACLLNQKLQLLNVNLGSKLKIKILLS